MKDSTAFSLVETVVAIGIFVFAIITVVALLPIGLNSNRVTVEESVAAMLAGLIDADLRSTDPAMTKSRHFGLGPLPYYPLGSDRLQLASANGTAGPSVTSEIFLNEASEVVTGAADARFRVRLRTVAGPGINGVSTNALVPMESVLSITWPAAVDPGAANAGSYDVVTSYLTFPAP